MMIKNVIFNTFPCILHHPGVQRRARKIKRIVSEGFVNKKPVPADLEILTTESNDRVGKTMLTKQCNRLKIPVTSLGNNIVVTKENKWNNLNKVTLVLDHVKKSDKKYFLYLDAADVQICGEIENILDFYKKNYDGKMLFNASNFFYAQRKAISRRTRRFWRKKFRAFFSGPYHNINAGVYICNKETLIFILEKCLEMAEKLKDRNINSDQTLLIYLFMTNPIARRKMSVDNECHVFQVVKRYYRQNLSYKHLLEKSQPAPQNDQCAITKV